MIKNQINSLKEDKKLLRNALEQYHKGNYEKAGQLLPEYKEKYGGHEILTLKVDHKNSKILKLKRVEMGVVVQKEEWRVFFPGSSGA